jgi:hypothetical protein
MVTDEWVQWEYHPAWEACASAAFQELRGCWVVHNTFQGPASCQGSELHTLYTLLFGPQCLDSHHFLPQKPFLTHLYSGPTHFSKPLLNPGYLEKPC